MTFRVFQETVAALQVQWVKDLLKQAQGNISEASRLAGVDRSNLLRWVREYGIDKNEFLPIGRDPLRYCLACGAVIEWSTCWRCRPKVVKKKEFT